MQARQSSGMWLFLNNIGVTGIRMDPLIHAEGILKNLTNNGTKIHFESRTGCSQKQEQVRREQAGFR